MIFDLLYLDGHSLMDRDYEERRAVLLELGLSGPAWQTPAHHVGDGARLLEASKAQGLEGIIAKRLDCPYTPGRRANGWVKVKNIRRTEAVDRRLAAGGGRALGPPRRARGRLLRGRRAALRRPRRHRLHRGGARAARRAARAARARGQPVRGPPAAEADALRRAAPRVRGRLLRGHQRRHAAPAVLQGAARRHRARGGRAGRRPRTSARRAARRRPGTRRRSACAPSSRCRSR